MKANDILILTAFLLLCMVFVGATVVVREIPTQDARAMDTISVPDVPQ